MRNLKTKISNLLSNPLTLTLTIISCAYLLLLFCYFILVALGNGINMDTYAANGTFQLYNPLRRLFEGQIIGHDFPFFHGVGVPLLHYPAFYILGHNVFAAETAKWLVSSLLFLASTLLFFFAFFKRINKAIIASALFAVISVYYIDVVYPGNSLVGIRTTFPVLIGAFMLWKPSFIISVMSRKISLYPVILFILFSLAFACGTEQGLAATLAYLILRLVTYIRSSDHIKNWWWRYCLEGASLGATTYFLLFLLTLGHANEALYYALIDIPKDQGWYFGAPPNSFLTWDTLSYILNERVLGRLAPFMTAGIVLFALALKSKLINQREQSVMYFFIAYGVLVFAASITGYWTPEMQLIPLARILGLIAVGIGVRLLFIHKTKGSTVTRGRVIKYTSFSLLIVLACLLARETYITYSKVTDYHIKYTLSTARVARHADDSAYLSSDWRDRINTFAPYINKGATIWSTYTSVYDSINGQLNGSSGGEDYIIHALGPERRNKYAQDFIEEQPDFVITLKPTYFPYEEWLWSRHWSFYQELVTNYEIIADNSSHILWKRHATTPILNQPLQKGGVAQKTNNTYTLNTKGVSPIRMYEVTVKYTVKKPIPLGDKVSRYILETKGTDAQHIPITLPPYLHEWKFPIIAHGEENSISITPNTYGFGLGSNLLVEQISYTEIPLSRANGFLVYNNYCSFGGKIPYGLRCDLRESNINYYNSHSFN